MSKFIPINGHIILRPIEVEQSFHGNIIIPDLGKDTPQTAEVVSLSNQWNYHTNEPLPNENLHKDLKVGSKVLVPRMGGITIQIEGIEHYIFQIPSIIAIIEK